MQSSLMGASLTIPIQQGRLALGTWQGIYLNEARPHVFTCNCTVPDSDLSHVDLHAHAVVAACQTAGQY